MTDTDVSTDTDIDTEGEGGPQSVAVRDAGPISPASQRVLLVWDAPNLDMGLGSLLGGRPTVAHRPRFDALGRWLLKRTSELSTGRPEVSLEPEATVFTNVAQGNAAVVRPWVEALRNVGYAVFAKPKTHEDSDVDSDMLDHIALRRGEGLAALFLASADAQAFRRPLDDLVAEGVDVTVLGFREHANWALASDTLGFVDLEDIPGVFREPLPRISLDSLPDQGAWLQPLRPLSSLLASRA